MITWIEINKRAINHNLKEFKRLLGRKTKIMAVVKSNAYGHGLIEVGRTALKAGADWLGVVNLKEALELRKAGIKSRLFVLSYWDIGDIHDRIRMIGDVDFPVYTLEQAEILSKIGKRIKKRINIHVKIDTGAARIGLRPDEAVEFIQKIGKLPGLKIQGIFTHYAASERLDQSYTNRQTEILNSVLGRLKLLKINIPWIHAACSASAIVNRATYFNMARIGIAMYGLWPSREIREAVKKKKIKFCLQPALSWKTKIIQIKELPAGAFIGYDCTYQTKKRTRIAVLPIGYWDGYDRRFSNNGYVLIHGERSPVRGRICMNLTMVEVTHIPEIKVGDEAVLVGKQGKEEITADEMAERIGTINYEVVTRINPLIIRKYV